ncbi:MAG TPA: DUF5985 family protein [Candidatus Baltobacteraceae bacterium]|nr:DUF5985 family protein [Candidatus Baltobacteraceae bacterium]
MFLFLSGMLMMGCFVLAVFFWRFWMRTSDRFFVLFAIAWVLLGLERLGLAIVNAPEEPRAGMYFVRLAAFLLIIVAIVDKNRAPSRR